MRTFFNRCAPRPNFLAPRKRPQLKRNVEARQTGSRVQFGHRYIMNAVRAVTDDAADLFDPHFAAVIVLASAARTEPRANDREDNGLKTEPVIRGERTVYENVPDSCHLERAERALPMAAFSSLAEKWVAFPFGLRIRTPSAVVPRTFLALAVLRTLRARTGAFRRLTRGGNMIEPRRGCKGSARPAFRAVQKVVPSGEFFGDLVEMGGPRPSLSRAGVEPRRKWR